MTGMAVSKVVYGTTVLVDLTGDTVTTDKLLAGVTAHDAAGNTVTGTVAVQTYRTGSGAPDDAMGVDGDLYFDLGG